MSLLAIDPAKKSIAWAFFHEQSLENCGFLPFDSFDELHRKIQALEEFLAFHLSDIVIEIPQIYNQRYWKGDPNDLIDVAFSAGAALGYINPYGEVLLVRPKEWKGSRPKDVDNRHTLKLLTEEEMAIYERMDLAKSLRHNVIDAIGIGLWAVERR